MKLKEWIKSYLDAPQEMFVGACLQFPLVFVVGWWVIPIMFACGILWRLGGAANSSKLFRRLGVPLVVCGASIPFIGWSPLLATPFMVWVNPFSYGASGWLFKLMKKVYKDDQEKADIVTRSLGYLWYWSVYYIAILLAF